MSSTLQAATHSELTASQAIIELMPSNTSREAAVALLRSNLGQSGQLRTEKRFDFGDYKGFGVYIGSEDVTEAAAKAIGCRFDKKRQALGIGGLPAAECEQMIKERLQAAIQGQQ